MPTRFRIELRERVVHADGPWRSSGPALHAALLDSLGRVDPRTAAHWHGAGHPKPFALAPLTRGAYEGTWGFEVGVLDDELVPLFGEALRSGTALRLGHSSFEQYRIAEDASCYAQLLADAVPKAQWLIRFATPTTFRTPSGPGPRRSHPLPLADRAFASLAGRWRRFSDQPLPDGVDDAIGWHLAVSQMRVETARCLIKPPGVYETGFVGVVAFCVVGGRELPARVLAGLDALVRFAEYAGVGDQTTKGMGVAAEMGSRRARPASTAAGALRGCRTSRFLDEDGR